MTAHDFTFCGAQLSALPSGILWWPEKALLCVSDLHLGKSERLARRGGTLIPPYEDRDTLNRLSEHIRALDPSIVVCLGDSFDDLAAQDALAEEDRRHLTSLIAGREWVWIEGNHDAGPVDIGGTHLRDYALAGLTFRHIAEPGAQAEISGHYHPKTRIRTRGRSITRPCFLVDPLRIILPAFGTYTGGLSSRDPAIAALTGPQTIAILTGDVATPVTLP